MDYEIVRGNVLSATSIRPLDGGADNYDCGCVDYYCSGTNCDIDTVCDINIDKHCYPVNSGCRYSCGGATKPCAEIMSTGSIG